MNCYVLHASGNSKTSIITFSCHESFSYGKMNSFD
jgi:hypothetical protein